MLLGRKQLEFLKRLQPCLLYTSDAADEEDSVDLGGRRIIKNRPEEGYPVFTVRTAAVNALGIPTVFFLGAILAMQFKSY